MSDQEMNIRLRPALLPDDEPFLRELYASRRDDLRTLPMEKAQVDALINMQYEAQRRGYEADYPGAEHFVIEVDGEPAGRYLIDRSSEAEDAVIDIAILPQFRAHGVGTQILSGSIDEARQAGKEFTLQVEPTNPAMRLYLRLGGEVVASNDVTAVFRWQARASRGTNG